MTRTIVAATALLTALVGLMLTSAPLLAQSKIERATAQAALGADDAKTESTQSAPTRERSTVTAMPASPSEAVMADPATKQRYLESMQRYYEYRANGYAYRSRVFEWQLVSSRLIFGVVLALVGAGIYFAAVQFRASMHTVGKAHRSADAKAGTGLETQLEVSSKGIVVNSSVMGVVILALSLAFFYLYLAYVYPITDVF